jgi:hypothetical protein
LPALSPTRILSAAKPDHRLTKSHSRHLSPVELSEARRPVATMRSSRQLLRSARASTLRRPTPASIDTFRPVVPIVKSPPSLQPSRTSRQRSQFSTTAFSFKGLQPDSSDPEPPKTERSHGHETSVGAAQISDAEYHEIADEYLNNLVLGLEEVAEKSTDGFEAEYSVHFEYDLTESPPFSSRANCSLSRPASSP